ncbi:hypothetical protein G6O67_001638 [Ophiocordyceps sinensis]|uniref:Uncharacterized protein n=1 Tax=Ophiocordyceps sinensis TaxID=72228 RepID=A0A8H4V916_9HYPO|nr:hypothetical protein G6O67_001638 [Ophiocordyceps sinensis]
MEQMDTCPGSGKSGDGPERRDDSTEGPVDQAQGACGPENPLILCSHQEEPPAKSSFMAVTGMQNPLRKVESDTARAGSG